MPRQYPQELRQRARVSAGHDDGDLEVAEFEAIESSASNLGISEESVHRWRRKAQVDAGERPGITSSEHAEIRKLKRQVAELRRANEILKAASAFLRQSSTAPRRNVRR